MKTSIRPYGFTLVELLVALTVFATMAALAYGGLNSIARTRGDLAKQEDRFATSRALSICSIAISAKSLRVLCVVRTDNNCPR